MILLIEATRTDDGATLTHTGTQIIHALGGVGDPARGYYAGLPGKFYAKVAHGADGTGPVFFSEATGMIFDNRIPALASDTTHYTFEVPAETQGVHVRARLIYRRCFRAIEDGKGWTIDGHGRPLQDVRPPDYGYLMQDRSWDYRLLSSVGGGGAVAAARPLDNFPNPANPATTIRFTLAADAPVRLEIFDTRGRRVAVLVDEARRAGLHTIDWRGLDAGGDALPSGIYFLRLDNGAGKPLVKQMVLVR